MALSKLTYGHFYSDGKWDCDHAFELTDFEDHFEELAQDGPTAIVDEVLGNSYLDYDQWLDQADQQQLADAGLEPKIAFENWASGWRACAINHVKDALKDWKQQKMSDTEVYYVIDGDDDEIVETFEDMADAFEMLSRMQPPSKRRHTVAIGDLHGPHETIAFMPQGSSGIVHGQGPWVSDVQAWRTAKAKQNPAKKARKNPPELALVQVKIKFEGLLFKATPDDISVAQDLLLDYGMTLYQASADRAIRGSKDEGHFAIHGIDVYYGLEETNVMGFYGGRAATQMIYWPYVKVMEFMPYPHGPVISTRSPGTRQKRVRDTRQLPQAGAVAQAVRAAWTVVKMIAWHKGGQGFDFGDDDLFNEFETSELWNDSGMLPKTPAELLSIERPKQNPPRNEPLAGPALSREFEKLVMEGDILVAQDLLLDAGQTLEDMTWDGGWGSFRVGNYGVRYSVVGEHKDVAYGVVDTSVRARIEVYKRDSLTEEWLVEGPVRRATRTADATYAAQQDSIRFAWNVVKDIANLGTADNIEGTWSDWSSRSRTDTWPEVAPPTPPEILEAKVFKNETSPKKNPPFDDFKKTVRNMGGLVNGKIDLRDSHDEELELFVMNEYELFNAVKGQGSTGVKAVVDQFFLYTPTQFEQLMEAVSARAQDAGTFHDNPRMDDDIDDAIASSTESNMELRRRLADAKAKVRELSERTKHKSTWSPDGQKLTKALALVRSLEAKIEQHSNLTAELGRPRNNPAPAMNKEREKALAKYKEFWRLEPTKIGEFAASFKIPTRVRKLGRAVHVLYESGKVDPENLKKPKKPLSYIHDHGKFVDTHDCQGAADTKVPDFIVYCDALVMLGKCLGFAWKDASGKQHDAEGTDPLPELWCTPDGHALLVIQSRKTVLAITWGEGLKVEARGIVG